MNKQKPPIQTFGSTEGAKLKIAGGDYRTVVSGAQTGGSFAVIEMTVPVGAGPNPHEHPAFNESFFVLEGTVTFEYEDGKYVAEKNAMVNIPLGAGAHGFKNLGDQPAKLLCTVMPAGLEQFFEEMAQLMEANTDVSELPEQIKTLSQKYGQTLHSEDYFKSKH